MSEAPASPNERRTFLGIILAAIGAFAAGAFGWSLFRFLSPVDRGGEDNQVRVTRDLVAIGGAHFFAFQGRPAVVLQPRAGEFVALSAVCTHLGCIVKWIDESQEFLCPCHAGRFAPSGQVLGGPPPRALDTYPVILDGDDILIG
ncbi:MAG: Rieske (2Fe-2S) protein [Desulfuromonadales bacterium]|nr:Rieske (2Fe-2S) protein [Desulfuromonadales bacterium]